MKTDTYQIVTDRIIAKLEAGTIPWKHFASSPLAEPRNLVTKKRYRGINHFAGKNLAGVIARSSSSSSTDGVKARPRTRSLSPFIDVAFIYLSRPETDTT